MTSAKSYQAEKRLLSQIQGLFPDSTMDVQNLKNPTKEFVVEWYSTFLSGFNLAPDNLFPLSSRQNDLFGDILPLARLSKVLRDVHQNIYSNDVAPFGLMDLLRPTPGRTVMFFTGMVNFLSYSASKYSEMAAFLKELEAKKRHWDELIKKREDLLASLNEKANIRAHLDDLEQKINEKQNCVRSLGPKVKDLEKQTAEKENIRKKLEAKLDQVNTELAQAMQEMDSVKIQVVNSPQSVKLQKKQLAKKLEDVEEKVVSAQNMLTHKRELVKILESVTEELQARHARVEKLLEEWRSINKKKESVAKLRKTHLKLSEEISKEISERQRLYVKEAELLECLSGLQLRWDNKKHDFQSRLTALKKENKDIGKQKTDEIRCLQNEEKMLVDNIFLLVKTNAALNKEYGELYAALKAGELRVGENCAREMEEALFKLKRLG